MFFLIPLAFTALASGAAIWNQAEQNSQLQAQATDELAKTEATNDATKVVQHVQYVAAVDAANAEAERLQRQALKSAESTRKLITTVFIVLAVVSLALTIRTLGRK